MSWIKFKNGRTVLKIFVKQTLESTWYNFLFLVMVFVDILSICLQDSAYVPIIAGCLYVSCSLWKCNFSPWVGNYSDVGHWRSKGWYLMGVQQLFIALYVIEVMLNFYIKRLRSLKKWWDNFGLVLVIMDLIGVFAPIVVHFIGNFSSASIGVLRLITALRAMRVLRLLRSIRFVRSLQLTVLSLVAAFPTIAAIVITISIVLYIFAFIGRGLYSDLDPDQYGNLALAGRTLFQLLTLDDWFQLYLDVIENNSGFQHILIFMILFIVIETFVFINLFVAVIVDTLARTQNIATTLQEDDNWDIEDKDHEDQNLEKLSKLDLVNSTQTDDLRKRYKTTLLSLKDHLDREKYHRKTLDRLVDMVDLSKSQDTS